MSSQEIVVKSEGREFFDFYKANKVKFVAKYINVYF
jgi:hypothetical protein